MSILPFMKKLVVFDLGETLMFYKGLALDWSEHYSNAITAASRACSIDIGKNEIERASSVLLKYNTRRNPRVKEISSQIIFGEILYEINADQKYLTDFTTGFFKYFQRKTVPEDTAVELLKFLKSRNIFIAVLTDVPYGMPNELVEVDIKPFENLIDSVVTSVDAGYRKPSTQGLAKILEKFNCDSADAILVGNEKKDIETAKGLGVFNVLLCPSGEIPPLNQDATISKLSELKNFIDK